MSCNPQSLAANEPTGAVRSASQRLPQPLQFARLRPMSGPQLYVVVVPARAAYSHSASLGRRYRSPVASDSHVTYAAASAPGDPHGPAVTAPTPIVGPRYASKSAAFLLPRMDCQNRFSCCSRAAAPSAAATATGADADTPLR